MPSYSKTYQIGNVQVIECTRAPSKPCRSCGRGAKTSCEYPLWGNQQGKVCGRLLCQNCAQTVDGKVLCPVHAQLSK